MTAGWGQYSGWGGKGFQGRGPWSRTREQQCSALQPSTKRPPSDSRHTQGSTEASQPHAGAGGHSGGGDDLPCGLAPALLNESHRGHKEGAQWSARPGRGSGKTPSAASQGPVSDRLFCKSMCGELVLAVLNQQVPRERKSQGDSAITCQPSDKLRSVRVKPEDGEAVLRLGGDLVLPARGMASCPVTCGCFPCAGVGSITCWRCCRHSTLNFALTAVTTW